MIAVLFSRTVEDDECYVGGSESNNYTNKRFKSENLLLLAW